MAALATAEDVSATWRPLTEDERARAATLLERLSATVRRRVPDLTVRMAADPDLRIVVVGIVAGAVERHMRNPDGVIQEQIDDYSRRLADGAAGGLALTEAEWSQLEPDAAQHGGAFTIRPYGAL